MSEQGNISDPMNDVLPKYVLHPIRFNEDGIQSSLLCRMNQAEAAELLKKVQANWYPQMIVGDVGIATGFLVDRGEWSDGIATIYIWRVDSADVGFATRGADGKWFYSGAIPNHTRGDIADFAGFPFTLSIATVA